LITKPKIQQLLCQISTWCG